MNPFERNPSTGSLPGDPFKATKMWDEIVFAFCMGIPAKRRRRRLTVYEDCFTARKAVDWMHNYLMFSSYFSRHEISRFQALQLLRKFATHCIIERVDRNDRDWGSSLSSSATTTFSSAKHHACDPEFKDNRDLYRLAPSVASVLPVHQPIPDDEDIGDADDQEKTGGRAGGRDSPNDISMDLEAEPVLSSTSSLPSASASLSSLPSDRESASAPMPPPRKPIIRLPSLYNSRLTGETSADSKGRVKERVHVQAPIATVAASLSSCCGAGTRSSFPVSGRSPFKPVNRSGGNSNGAIASNSSSSRMASATHVRRIPDDLFWL